MPDKKDKKPKRTMKPVKEPKPAVIDPIVVPAVAFTEKAKVKSLAKEPSKQSDYKPDYLKDAQYSHQMHLKTLPDSKPTPADLVSRGLQYAGEVATRLGKSAAKIEKAVEQGEAPVKRKPGRPKMTEEQKMEKKAKKQGAKAKEDEKLAMEVKGTKDAVAAVAKELAHHEEMSEAEEQAPAVVVKKKRTTKAKEGTVDGRKIRGQRLSALMKEHKISMTEASKMLAKEKK
jgi:hypothetical protein